MWGTRWKILIRCSRCGRHWLRAGVKLCVVNWTGNFKWIDYSEHLQLWRGKKYDFCVDKNTATTMDRSRAFDRWSSTSIVHQTAILRQLQCNKNRWNRTIGKFRQSVPISSCQAVTETKETGKCRDLSISAEHIESINRRTVRNAAFH